MARAYPQTPPTDDERSPGEWQSLRHELVALLDQVDSRVAQSRPSARYAPAADDTELRHRDALRSVQRAITRFDPPEAAAPALAAANPRDSLQAAINQIRQSQGAPMQQPAPRPMERPAEPPMFDKLAQSVNGLSGRLERLEGEIKAQIKTGANVKDVADQVAQLAHVVELLAGAVGETGQVKRLEGQIASLGKIMSQGREMDIQTLTRRLDDVASTVGKLAELQVHFTDKIQNPVETQAFQNGMASIEESVRGVYDRIDALERQSSLSPADLEHVTTEMARFTEVLRTNTTPPQHLVELVDALNSRISDIESGDRLLHGLRKDLSALRDAVTVSLAPRFDAIEQRIETLSGAVSTHADMAEIGRQIGSLSDRIGERPIDPGIGQLEAQVRQLVARMDQTGEQLSGLAKLYAGDPSASMPDLDVMADMVATRTIEAMGRQGSTPDASLNATLEGLESRITAMLQSMQQQPEAAGFDSMQDTIGEVNDRLKRLESSLLARSAGAGPFIDTSADTPAPAAPVRDIAALIAARFDAKPALPAPPLGFEPEHIPVPPAPQPSAGFFEATHPVEADTPAPQVSQSSRNTFIEAARRAQQRPVGRPEANPNSLIGRALGRFQTAGSEPKVKAEPETAVERRQRKRTKPLAAAPLPAPAPETAPSIEPQILGEGPQAPVDAKESFLLRNRKTILLAAAVVALACLTLNLVAQRLNAPGDEAATAVEAPATTGDISPAPEPADTMTPSMPPRVIPMTDPLSTGSIDRSAAQGFTTAAPQTMPSAFQAATDLANAAPTGTEAEIAPLEALPAVSPVKVDMPPDSVGPLDLRQAAADGDARAQFEIAAIYTEGRAIPQDYKAAATWYERAAAQGFVPAEYRLGSLYESGNGVTKDLNTARLWYERAAEAGNRMSMHNLAALYAGGQLGKQQFDSAAKWFEEAAARGLTDSQFNLGMLYARGLGVPQDLSASYKWFSIAALSGDKDSAKARDDIARSLGADKVAAVQAEVAAFKPVSIDLAANFAPIGTWSKTFDPGETIASRDIVANVQKALGKLGYDIGTPDGVAGKKTAEAIKSFEAATGMSQVGQINPRLLAVLGSQPV